MSNESTSCYKVVSPTIDDVTQSRDYWSAASQCASDGARLVAIESVGEQRHLAAVLAEQPGKPVPWSSLISKSDYLSLVVCDIFLCDIDMVGVCRL